MCLLQADSRLLPSSQIIATILGELVTSHLTSFFLLDLLLKHTLEPLKVW